MTAFEPTTLDGLLRAAVADPATSWSLGSFGAVAEFLRDADEPAELRLDGPVLEARTARGALRIRSDATIRPIAYETASGSGWNHAVALCLPTGRCAMAGRTVVTELGPDRDAMAAEDRDGILFDLGLGLPQADACVRSNDPAVVERLRTGVGRTLFDPENPLGRAMPALSPARVFLGRFGRIEVDQPIPPPDGKSPEGPHTHVLPKLLAAGRTHAATAPIPDGWVPVMHLFPPHPMKDGHGRPIPFDRKRHDGFQAILRDCGNPELVALKRRVLEALRNGADPVAADTLGRAGRMTVRATLRQVAAMGSPPVRLRDWLLAHDRGDEGV